MPGRRLHAVIVLLFPLLLRAQGTTSAAMHGTVATETGSAIHGAIDASSTIQRTPRWEFSTRSGCRFFFEDLAGGGSLSHRRPRTGFCSGDTYGVSTSPGANRIDTLFVLKPAAIALLPVM